MSIRELRADATDAAFDSFGDDFELLATGPDAGPQPVREIWTRPGSKTGMGQLDVLAERPNRDLIGCSHFEVAMRAGSAVNRGFAARTWLVTISGRFVSTASETVATGHIGWN